MKFIFDLDFKMDWDYELDENYYMPWTMKWKILFISDQEREKGLSFERGRYENIGSPMVCDVM
jgi:hypothetical protein